MAQVTAVCPHCGGGLVRWNVPDGATWEEPFFLACFSDDCPYYREGWDWMFEQFGQRASFRYAEIPGTGERRMIPVWSEGATRMQIVAGGVEGGGR
jgi:hypothetical protein